jgi:high-affinity nickel permease
MQTKTQSLIETCVSVAIGYLVALLSQIIIFPLFNIYVSMSDNLLITAWFTGISIIRSYFIRRLFNQLHKV